MKGTNKEVDEWLMGSGDTAETAASKQDSTLHPKIDKIDPADKNVQG